MGFAAPLLRPAGRPLLLRAAEGLAAERLAVAEGFALAVGLAVAERLPLAERFPLAVRLSVAEGLALAERLRRLAALAARGTFGLLVPGRLLPGLLIAVPGLAVLRPRLLLAEGLLVPRLARALEASL